MQRSSKKRRSTQAVSGTAKKSRSSRTRALRSVGNLHELPSSKAKSSNKTVIDLRTPVPTRRTSRRKAASTALVDEQEQEKEKTRQQQQQHQQKEEEEEQEQKPIVESVEPLIGNKKRRSSRRRTTRLSSSTCATTSIQLDEEDDDDDGDVTVNLDTATSGSAQSASLKTVADELEDLNALAVLLENQEDKYPVSPSWVEFHPALRASMRAILLDWLRECSEGYKLSRTTYQTAVNIFDRFMSDRYNIPRAKVQLIGAASLLVAGKMEQSYRAPSVSSLLYYCDGLYSRLDLLRVESLILKVLRWRVAAPTPHIYAKLLLQRETLLSAHNDDQTRDWQGNGQAYGIVPSNGLTTGPGFGAVLQAHIRKPLFNTVLLAAAMQILDAAMLDIECLKYRPSMLARCSIIVARAVQRGAAALDVLRARCAGNSATNASTTSVPTDVASVWDIDASHESQQPPTPALTQQLTPSAAQLSEQRRCLQWMLRYENCVLQGEKACQAESYEIQDWDNTALPKVRVILRQRARELPPDPTRSLVNALQVPTSETSDHH